MSEVWAVPPPQAPVELLELLELLDAPELELLEAAPLELVELFEPLDVPELEPTLPEDELELIPVPDDVAFHDVAADWVTVVAVGLDPVTDAPPVPPDPPSPPPPPPQPTAAITPRPTTKP